MPFALNPFTGKMDYYQVSGGGGGGGVSFGAGVANGDILKANVTAGTLQKVTGIPQSLIVPNQVLTSFTNTAGAQEIGYTLNDWYYNWTLNRAPDPTSQTLGSPIGSVSTAVRTYHVTSAGLTTNLNMSLTVVGDDTTNSVLYSFIGFYNKTYWGVYPSIITTGADVMTYIATQNGQLTAGRAITKTFDASAGSPPNYLYFSWPASYGAPSVVTFGGFTFTDYTLTTSSLTNAQGHTESYYIFRTNPTYNGAGLTLVIS